MTFALDLRICVWDDITATVTQEERREEAIHNNKNCPSPTLKVPGDITTLNGYKINFAKSVSFVSLDNISFT
jgi:hypothetical protein